MLKSLQLIILLIVFVPFTNFAQTGGTGIYKFLKLSNSARISALGGNNVALYDDDLNTSFYNPALLNSEMNGNIVLNYVNYFAGLNFGYVAYGYHTDKYGSFSAGMHYLNYGDFTAADEGGNITGTFGAADYALNLIWAKQIHPNISIGANLKPIYSHLEKYSSFGLVSDIGVTYFKKETDFAASVVLKNYYQRNSKLFSNKNVKNFILMSQKH